MDDNVAPEDTPQEVQYKLRWMTQKIRIFVTEFPDGTEGVIIEGAGAVEVRYFSGGPDYQAKKAVVIATRECGSGVEVVQKVGTRFFGGGLLPRPR